MLTSTWERTLSCFSQQSSLHLSSFCDWSKTHVATLCKTCKPVFIFSLLVQAVFLQLYPTKKNNIYMNKLGYQVTAFLLLLTYLNYFTEIFCICFWREQIKFGPCAEHSEWRWPQNSNIFLFPNTPIFQILGDTCYIHILFVFNSYQRKLLLFYGFRSEQAKKKKKRKENRGNSSAISLTSNGQM